MTSSVAKEKASNARSEYSFRLPNNRAAFFDGVKVGVPIGMGDFVVAFALGVQAKAAGLTAFQCGLASFFCLASAGERVGFSSIAENASYSAIVLATLVANARYFLMSCALSRRCSPRLSLFHRALVGFGLTDESFGMAILRPGYFNPWFAYGIMVVPVPLWTIGSALGVAVGAVLSPQWVSALGVALFGMFLAVIVPPCRKNKVVAALVASSFIFSFLMTRTPILSGLSEGSRVVVLTLILASLAAIAFPVDEDIADELNADSASLETDEQQC